MRQYTLGEHLFEMKYRAKIIFSVFILALIVSYIFSNNIYQFFLDPLIDLNNLNSRKIIYTGLTEAFFTYLKLSIFTAFCITFPVIIWQIYQFIVPGLYDFEKKIVALILFLSPILFFLGGFFVYYCVMPRAWSFFLSFENNNPQIPLVLEARISEYLSLVMQLIVAFGIAFQMPNMMIILKILNIIQSDTLRKYRRFAIVINFIFAAIFTPPDILSQIALALPLLLLYELSILLCQLLEKRGTKNA